VARPRDPRKNDPRDQGEGYIAQVGELPGTSVDRTSLGTVLRALNTLRLALESIFDRIISRINGRLTLGTGDHNTLSGNLQGLRFDYLVTAANTDFVIPHNLGYVPSAWIVLWCDNPCNIYAGSVGANSSTVTLRLDAGIVPTRIKLWIF
jgi:hypothetical protein